MNCRNCRDPIRPAEAGDGIDKDDLETFPWIHEDGGPFCDIQLVAEPDPEVPGPELFEVAGRGLLAPVTYANGSSGDLMPEIQPDGTWTFTAPEGASAVAGVRVEPGQVVRGKVGVS
jgi:hypothetical protein